MRRGTIVAWGLGAMLIALAPGKARAQDPGADDGAQDGIEVLTRGPIHEAFAGPTVLNAKPGIVVAKQPPDPIQEVPPDQRPEGDVVWIPGYFSWDDERQDFLWVSGIWREPPPGRSWNPGYWSLTADGHQWTSGYWAVAGQDEVEFLPQPPPSVERGPQTPRPGDEYFWIPGNYVWRVNNYYWSPGFWSAYHQGWVWTPSCYYWTPRGYLYNPGGWDLEPSARGVMFAPVVVTSPRWAGIYRPRIMLSLGCVTAHLWARPARYSYYFGDYYDTRYVGAGYYPWFQYSGRIGYDPLYSYYNTSFYRTNPRWGAELALNFNRARNDVAWRPPHTLIQQRNVVNNITNVSNVNNVTNITNVNKVFTSNTTNNNVNANRLAVSQMAVPLSTVQRTNAIKLTQVDDVRRKEFVDRAAQVRQAQAQRSQFERGPRYGDGAEKMIAGAKAGAAGRPAPGGAPTTATKAKLPQPLVNNIAATNRTVTPTPGVKPIVTFLPADKGDRPARAPRAGDRTSVARTRARRRASPRASAFRRRRRSAISRERCREGRRPIQELLRRGSRG